MLSTGGEEGHVLFHHEINVVTVVSLVIQATHMALQKQLACREGQGTLKAIHVERSAVTKETC